MYRRTSSRVTNATAGTKRTAPPTGPHIAELAEQDCKKICNPDLNRPFNNLDDAVDRLLPYHVRFFSPSFQSFLIVPVAAPSTLKFISTFQSSYIIYNMYLKSPNSIIY